MLVVELLLSSLYYLFFIFSVTKFFGGGGGWPYAYGANGLMQSFQRIFGNSSNAWTQRLRDLFLGDDGPYCVPGVCDLSTILMDQLGQFNSTYPAEFIRSTVSTHHNCINLIFCSRFFFNLKSVSNYNLNDPKKVIRHVTGAFNSFSSPNYKPVFGPLGWKLGGEFSCRNSAAECLGTTSFWRLYTRVVSDKRIISRAVRRVSVERKQSFETGT